MRRDPAEVREREMNRLKSSSLQHRMPDVFSFKVVGVSFTPHYPANLHVLDGIDLGIEPLPVILRRNPDNEYDSNAIEVHVTALGDKGFIGHVPGPMALRMAPGMDEGERWHATVTDVLINPDHPDRPGISIRCERAPEEA